MNLAASLDVDGEEDRTHAPQSERQQILGQNGVKEIARLDLPVQLNAPPSPHVLGFLHHLLVRLKVRRGHPGVSVVMALHEPEGAGDDRRSLSDLFVIPWALDLVAHKRVNTLCHLQLLLSPRPVAIMHLKAPCENLLGNGPAARDHVLPSQDDAARNLEQWFDAFAVEN